MPCGPTPMLNSYIQERTGWTVNGAVVRFQNADSIPLHPDSRVSIHGSCPERICRNLLTLESPQSHRLAVFLAQHVASMR